MSLYANSEPFWFFIFFIFQIIMSDNDREIAMASYDVLLAGKRPLWNDTEDDDDVDEVFIFHFLLFIIFMCF